MGSVSTDREEAWGQGNASWQGQLQAAETWAGGERELLPSRSWEGDSGTSLLSLAVQMPSAEQAPGLLSHPAKFLPSRPWVLKLSRILCRFSQGGETPECSLGKSVEAFLHLALLSMLPLVFPSDSLATRRLQVQCMHRRCRSCDAAVSMGAKCLSSFQAVGLWTVQCVGLGTELALLRSLHF